MALGPGAHTWLVEAAAAGAQRVRSRMTAAVEHAALVGTGPVDAARGVAAAAGRFAEGDLLAFVHHRANGASAAALVVADEDHSSPAPAPGPPSAPNQMPPPRRHHDRRDRPRAATPAWASDLPDELLAVLKRMRLPYLRSAAPQVLATARVQRWDPADVLRVLITKEIRGRDGTRRVRRKAAGLPPGKTFDSWREAAGQ